jgi:membrane protein DedA with SNARE-associated domain
MDNANNLTDTPPPSGVDERMETTPVADASNQTAATAATGGQGLSLGRLVRKYWYVLPILAVILGVLIYVIYHSGKDPKLLLQEYGYWVILIWTFLEGETIVVIAGWLSPSLGLNPWLIALCAFGGSFASDQFMFSLGKYKGEDALKLFPRLAKNMDKATALFRKYDIALILGFRFVYGVRNVTPILLGISGVSHKKFFFLNFIGAGVWALAFTFGGLYVGQAFMMVMGHVGHGIFYVLLALAVAAGLLWYLRSRRAVRAAKKLGESKK